jgi:hypothetical protein
MGYIGTKPADAALTSSDLEDGIVTAAKIATDAVETAKVKDLNVTVAKLPAAVDISTKTVTLPASVSGLGTGLTNSQLVNSEVTINSQAVSLGGSVTIDTYTADLPTITSLTPSVVPNDATAVVIAGTNFVSIPVVEAINASTGAITVATSVSFTSATSITATFTLPTDGTYYVRVENNNGLAVRTASADLTVSDAPEWVTASGSLGSYSGSTAISTITLTCTDATSFAVTTGAVTAGLTFTTGVGSATITGTQTAHTTAATDSFTVTATDAEGQTSDRAFTITWVFDIAGSGGFN